MGRYRSKRWVSPFGDLRITGCSPLPEAFRRVPRPSSPLGAKASTKCPYLSLENLSIPMRQHTPGTRPREPGTRNNVSLLRDFSLIRTHTVVDARGQEPGARRLAAPTPSRHRRPVQHPTSIALAAPQPFRDDRRLDGCQNPLHVSKNQRSDVRCQMSEHRHRTVTSANQQTNYHRRGLAPLHRPDICPPTSVLRNGADRSRTDDLLNANQALSQLSYGPGIRRQDRMSDVRRERCAGVATPLTSVL
jgi:hypothetical protein